MPVLDCSCLAVQAVARVQAESGGQDAGVVVEEEGKQCDQHAPQHSFLGAAHHHAHYNGVLCSLGRAARSRAPRDALGMPSPPSAVAHVHLQMSSYAGWNTQCTRHLCVMLFTAATCV